MNAREFRMATKQQHGLPAACVDAKTNFEFVWLPNALNLSSDKHLQLIRNGGESEAVKRNLDRLLLEHESLYLRP